MTLDDLKKIVREQIDPSLARMYENTLPDYELKIPILHVYDGDHLIIVGLVCDMSVGEKNRIAAFMKMLVFVGAEAVVFACESWGVSLPVEDKHLYDEWRDAHPHAHLKEFPGAVEALTSLAACHEGRFLVTHNILREAGKSPRLVDRKEGGVIESRFSDGLPFTTQERIRGMRVKDVLGLIAQMGLG